MQVMHKHIWLHQTEAGFVSQTKHAEQYSGTSSDARLWMCVFRHAHQCLCPQEYVTGFQESRLPVQLPPLYNHKQHVKPVFRKLISVVKTLTTCLLTAILRDPGVCSERRDKKKQREVSDLRELFSCFLLMFFLLYLVLCQFYVS